MGSLAKGVLRMILTEIQLNFAELLKIHFIASGKSAEISRTFSENFGNDPFPNELISGSRRSSSTKVTSSFREVQNTLIRGNGTFRTGVFVGNCTRQTDKESPERNSLQ